MIKLLLTLNFYAERLRTRNTDSVWGEPQLMGTAVSPRRRPLRMGN